MRLRHTWRAGAAAAVGAVLLSLAVATPASAAPPALPASAAPPVLPAPAAPYGLKDCPDNYMCAWEHAYHSGKYIYMKTGCYDFNSCFASPFRNKATAMWNRTPYTWCFYTSTNLSGGRYEVASGALIDNVGVAWNDQFESAYRC